MAFAPVDVQLATLLRGVVDSPAVDELKAKLEKSRETNTPLRVKAGFDPTAPDLHLGHTVVLTKMRQFQDLGHTAIFLVGDFTALIGDPTGKSATRKPLSPEQIQVNAQTYKDQVFKLLDPELTEVRFNSEWLNELGSAGMITLAAKYNVARMLERDDFKKRYASGQSISVHEFLYPLVQGYDSVALAADVELGGTDQLFNLLVGRHLMKEYGQAPQCVLTTPLLEGLDARLEDGKIVGNKMSKSLNNYVGVEDDALDMFGKLMSLTDDVMWRYYDLLSTRPSDAIAELRASVTSGETHPKSAKVDLGKEIVSRYHSPEAADAAAAEWNRVFSQRQIPEDMPEVTVAVGTGIISALRDAGLVKSGGDARRMLAQGAVSIDGERVSSVETTLDQAGSFVIKVGKRRFARFTVG